VYERLGKLNARPDDLNERLDEVVRGPMRWMRGSSNSTRGPKTFWEAR
jgi:hypothetical protein